MASLELRQGMPWWAYAIGIFLLVGVLGWSMKSCNGVDAFKQALEFSEGVREAEKKTFKKANENRDIIEDDSRDITKRMLELERADALLYNELKDEVLD